MIDVSVITINYKEAEKTKMALQSLLQSKKVTFEVIIIDNSCDNTEINTLSSIKDKRVRLYGMKENVGCAKGYNFGVRHAKGKYIFILNNDAEIDNSLGLYRMKQYLDHHPKVAVIQPKIKSIINKKTFDYAGASGGFIDKYGYPFCRGRLFQTLEDDSGQYDDVIDISWASTCAFFSRRKLIEKAGLFDPIYFAYAEEVDISLKIWSMGYKIQIFPMVTVYHYGESSWKKQKAKKTFLIHRNHLILYLKCFKKRDALRFAPSRIIHELASVGFYIVTLRPLLVFPIFQAYSAVVALLPEIMRSRKKFFRNYHDNTMPLYKQSIVASHYLWRKKYFTDLDIISI